MHTCAVIARHYRAGAEWSAPDKIWYNMGDGPPEFLPKGVMTWPGTRPLNATRY